MESMRKIMWFQILTHFLLVYYPLQEVHDLDYWCPFHESYLWIACAVFVLCKWTPTALNWQNWEKQIMTEKMEWQHRWRLEYVDSLRHISRQKFTIHKLKGRGNTFSQTLSAAIWIMTSKLFPLIICTEFANICCKRKTQSVIRSFHWSLVNCSHQASPESK